MENFLLWKECIDYARYAPSPHNVQPWKIKLISETEADLFYDPKRLLPEEDPTGQFLMTGFGIFFEALNISAKAKKFKIQVEHNKRSLDVNGETILFLCHLSLVPTTEPENLNRELIMKRRTSRLPYKKQEISKEILNDLQDIAKNFGQTFTFSADKKIIDWVLKLNKDTMFYDMNDEKARTEVGQWVRYTSKQAETKKDGLWAFCMNVPALVMHIFFKARWIINLPIIYSLVGKFYLNTTRTSTVGWLQGPFKTTEDWINSGRMLMRLWLTMTSHNIYLHPFGSIITNQKSHQRLREKFQLNEHENTLWLILRLGYSDIPPRSYRLDLEEIFI